jgi:hypothetical protein
VTTARRPYKVTRRPERDEKPQLHTLTVIAPQRRTGGWLSKTATYAAGQVGWGVHPDISPVDWLVFRKAMLAAQKGGIERWNEARALLIAAGWEVHDGQVSALED